jgi:hypothetical protein
MKEMISDVTYKFSSFSKKMDPSAKEVFFKRDDNILISLRKNISEEVTTP